MRPCVVEAFFARSEAKRSVPQRRPLRSVPAKIVTPTAARSARGHEEHQKQHHICRFGNGCGATGTDQDLDKVVISRLFTLLESTEF